MTAATKSTKRPLPPNAGKGRKKGVPNKATVEAREAIARFVDKNAGRLQDWLDEIAAKDPEKAFSLFQSVIEYHVPKLARTDLTTGDKPFQTLSEGQIESRIAELARKAGILKSAGGAGKG